MTQGFKQLKGQHVPSDCQGLLLTMFSMGCGCVRGRTFSIQFGWMRLCHQRTLHSNTHDQTLATEWSITPSSSLEFFRSFIHLCTLSTSVNSSQYCLQGMLARRWLYPCKRKRGFAAGRTYPLQPANLNFSDIFVQILPQLAPDDLAMLEYEPTYWMSCHKVLYSS